jgi:hypothetical protein
MLAACADNGDALMRSSAGNSAVAAAAMEAALRTMGHISGAELVIRLLTSASALQPQQQQFLPEQCGLYITCLKAAAAAVGGGVPTMQLLAAIAGLAQQLPGIEIAAARAGSNFESSVGELLGLLQQLEADNLFSGSNSSSSSSSGSSSSAEDDDVANTGGMSASTAGTAAAASGADDALLLLHGRTLYTAGQALIHLHAQQGAAAAAEMQKLRDGVSGIQTLLLGCVNAVGPALKQAAASMHGVGSSSSSSSSSNKAVAVEQSLMNLLQHQQKLKATLASAVFDKDDSREGSTSVAAAASETAGGEVSEAWVRRDFKHVAMW